MESAALGDHLRLDVSWVAEPFGPGPRAAVYAGDDELMLLDCFGKAQGHMHLNLKQSRLAPEGGAARLSFPPGSVEEHIRRAEFELRHNLRYAIQVNRDPRVRAITVSDATLDQAAAWMGERMRALVASAAQANQPASQPLEPPVGTRR